MSVFTRNRTLLLVFIALAAAPAAFAADPAARSGVRMVYDARTTRTVLFGGSTPLDAGTQLTYQLSDTWEWVGDHWVQRFPAHTPPGRSAHVMVYDSVRQRSIIFGGNATTTQPTITSTFTYLNDTWAYDGTDWTQLTPATSPAARVLAGAAYDSGRDRVVMFGGYTLSADNKTASPVYDTWEFDGTNWKQTAATGPTVVNPILVYDPSRSEMLMLGMSDISKQTTVMYSYDPASSTWKQIVPPTLPDCVNEGNAAFQDTDNTVIFFGGTCTTSGLTGETWQWDGANWSKMSTVNDPDRINGQAMTYDANRQQVMMYGGTLAFGNPRAATLTLKDGTWNELHDPVSPSSRSLFAMATDPDNGTIWMLGGQNETDVITDFWEYQNGKWTSNINLSSGPAVCSTPTAAYDTDRKKLVVVCADSSTYEWDGAAQTWTTESPKTTPTQRRFSSMAYDPAIKKTVLFGGMPDDASFSDETWLWDGTNWTRQKNNHPESRQGAAMWWDAQMQKVVLYGGIGRASTLDRIERYGDMWSYDGSNWTEMKTITTAPPPRYGAQWSVDPKTNDVLLIGGLRLDVVGQLSTQVYANDMWQWDGNAQKWTQLQPAHLPTARENGRMVWDPSQNVFVLFGGFNGLYLSDLWTCDPAKNDWTQAIESINDIQIPTPPRRRGVGH